MEPIYSPGGLLDRALSRVATADAVRHETRNLRLARIAGAAVLAVCVSVAVAYTSRAACLALVLTPLAGWVVVALHPSVRRARSARAAARELRVRLGDARDSAVVFEGVEELDVDERMRLAAKIAWGMSLGWFFARSQRTADAVFYDLYERLHDAAKARPELSGVSRFITFVTIQTNPGTPASSVPVAEHVARVTSYAPLADAFAAVDKVVFTYDHAGALDTVTRLAAAGPDAVRSAAALADSDLGWGVSHIVDVAVQLAGVNG